MRLPEGGKSTWSERASRTSQIIGPRSRRVKQKKPETPSESQNMECIRDSIRFLDDHARAEPGSCGKNDIFLFGIQIALTLHVAPCSTLLRYTAVMPGLSQMSRPNDDATVNPRGSLPESGSFQEASDWPFVHKGRLRKGGPLTFPSAVPPASVLYLKQFLQSIVFARTLCLAS